MKVLIGADVVATQSNEAYFSSGDIKKILDAGIIQLINTHDFRVYNLETPLYDGETPILKCGPNLKNKTSVVNGLMSIKPDLFTLANNHIYDHGEKGLYSTIEVLSQHKIGYVGAGLDIQEARKAYVYEQDGIKIAFFGCCEHEFSCATDDKSGANPFDPLETFDDIKAISQEADKVIVLYHGGKEYYRYPSPWLQKVGRKFIESGADLVICQHSHCIGSKELYKNGTIVYGQGNFIFDLKSDEYWNSGLLISLEITKNDPVKVDYIPLEKKDGKILLSSDAKLLSEFENRSIKITDSKFVEQHYSSFSDGYILDYLTSLRGKKNFFERATNKLTKGRSRKWLCKLIHNKHSLAVTLNYIECEAHRELLIQGLKDRIK